MLDYGAKGETEAQLTCAFVADAVHDLITRVAGRETLWGARSTLLGDEDASARTSLAAFLTAALMELVIGSGLGLMSTAFVIAVQNAVPWNLRGVATASTQFVRTIGGTVGVALMGTILNTQMAQLFAPIFARFPSAVAHLPKNVAPSNVLLTPDVRRSLPLDFLGQLQAALAHSLFWVYLLTLVLAVIGLAAWLGAGPLMFAFLNGSSRCLWAWGLLPDASRARFGWATWAVAAIFTINRMANYCI